MKKRSEHRLRVNAPIVAKAVFVQVGLKVVGRWPRSSQASQTMNEGAPGPSHLGARDASNLDSCDLNHDDPVSPEKRG